jgi:DNA repair photolyase
MVERLLASDAWEVNTYQACDIRCTYCITRAQGTSRPRFRAAEVPDRLRRELDGIGRIDRLGVGAFCDVYPGPEAELGVTRAALTVLAERDLGFHLITKGPAIARDVDLLARPGVEAQISLNSLDEQAIASTEPGAAPPAVRLDALRRLVAGGVATRLQISPWIPGITDVRALLDAVECLPIEVTITPLRLPPYLTHVGHRLGLDQAEVNEAFRREYERVGPRPNVRWSRPPSLEGAPPRIESNVGQVVVTDWEPAPAAHAAWMPPMPAARQIARRTS